MTTQNYIPILPPGSRVRLTQTARCIDSGHILPAGAVGRVIMYKPEPNVLTIDFGIVTHFLNIPPGSPLIEPLPEAGDA